MTTKRELQWASYIFCRSLLAVWFARFSGSKHKTGPKCSRNLFKQKGRMEVPKNQGLKENQKDTILLSTKKMQLEC